MKFSWGLSLRRPELLGCPDALPTPRRGSRGPAEASLAGPPFLLCSPWPRSTRSWRGCVEGRGAGPPDGPPLSAAASTRARGSGACSRARGKGAAGQGGAVWACWAGGRFRSQDQSVDSEACGRPAAVQGVLGGCGSRLWRPGRGRPDGAGGLGAADPGLIPPSCPQRAWGPPSELAPSSFPLLSP